MSFIGQVCLHIQGICCSDRKDRDKGKGGGVLLYVKSTLKCKQIEWPSEFGLECVGVNISLSAEMSFILICMYRKHSAKLDFYDQLKQILNHCNLKKEVIIMGDFNINWNERKERKKIKQIFDYFNFTQLIEQPTRITPRSKTRIDLLFTNKPEIILKHYNCLTGLSDHNVIFFSRKLTKQRFLNSFKNTFYQDIVKSNQITCIVTSSQHMCLDE